MFNASKIASIADEYDDVERMLRSIVAAGNNEPEDLKDRAELLVHRLIATRASSSLDVAHKALVLLDRLETTDLPGELTRSLCHDVIRLFLPTAAGAPAQS